MTPIVLGVDGGGTSTTAWLAGFDGPSLGRGVGGPSNGKAIPLDAARASLDQAVRMAFADAGLSPRPVDACCLGLAGYDRPEDKRWLEAWSAGSPWPAGRLVLVNDGDLVVAAGTPEGWGVGLIAGTGSIAVGRDRDGRTARAGGWGYLFGDEGSAYAVALAGLRLVAHRADGRAEGSPALTRRLCEALGIESPSGLVAAVYREGFDRAKLAALAPAVVLASEDDPSIAAEVFEPAGEALALMVEAVARKLGLDRGGLPLAMAGSFLLNCPAVSRAVVDRLAALGREVAAAPVPHPVEGALILARRGGTR